MKKNQKKNQKILFIILLLIIALGVVSARERIVSLMTQVVGPEVIVLYDQKLDLPGCSLAGADNCASLDSTTLGQIKKTISVSAFVSGSGYIAVYYAGITPLAGSFSGGVTSSNIYFEPSSGGRLSLGAGFQVFERGNVVIEFDQPYTSNQRLDVEYDFVVYFLPHSEQERQSFLIRLQDDPADFEKYKADNKSNFAPICAKLRGRDRSPSVCGSDTSGAVAPSTGRIPGFESDPSVLPEYDFSGEPSRRPEVTIHERERLTFIGQPVSIDIDEVYDPDGKCQFFEYRWQKPSRMAVTQASIDPRLGGIFFIPQNAGTFTIRLLVREACKELGNLSSDRVNVQIVVNDKSVAFPDLQNSKYANPVYTLYHLGVMKGYDDGTMRPDLRVNRAEFLKMIFETLSYRIAATVYSPRYPDVPTDAWFSPYVHQADELGVIKGYPGGEFKPSRTVNLVEALKMVMMFSTLEIMDGTVYKFVDSRPFEDWFSRYIQTAFREGILDDVEPGGYVYPDQAITRGKAALIIVRTLLFPVNRINTVDTDVLRRPDVFEDFSSFIY